MSVAAFEYGSITEPLAEITVRQPVSIIVPTYREAENIPQLLQRLEALRRRYKLTLEVLFMDDDSRDGSVEAVRSSGYHWARIVVRTKNRGLSQAVIDGLHLARYPVVVCMDCDLSHPPEKIPDMVLALSSGQQMVLGSRYVSGGTTDDDWSYARYFNSAVATLLARPLTAVRDPMSGFFALRRAAFDRAKDLNPIGYKIALELIVKCGFDNIGEVPIHFTDRVHGESKLTFREQLRYLQHLRRLYIHKFTNSMYVVQFLAVGAIGTVVNLSMLTITQAAGASTAMALAVGIGTSIVSNFLLNRHFTFADALGQGIKRQFTLFATASLAGTVLNYSVALALVAGPFAESSHGLQLAALAGIAAGTALNFMASRFFVFRKTHLRLSEAGAARLYARSKSAFMRRFSGRNQTPPDQVVSAQ